MVTAEWRLCWLRATIFSAYRPCFGFSLRFSFLLVGGTYGFTANTFGTHSIFGDAHQWEVIHGRRIKPPDSIAASPPLSRSISQPRRPSLSIPTTHRSKAQSHHPLNRPHSNMAPLTIYYSFVLSAVLSLSTTHGFITTPSTTLRSTSLYMSTVDEPQLKQQCTLDGQKIRGPITPLGNFVLVKTKDSLDATEGGILLPDQVRVLYYCFVHNIYMPEHCLLTCNRSLCE